MFACDTRATDKVKDKPSVHNSSPATLAGIGASKCVLIRVPSHLKLVPHGVQIASVCVWWGESHVQSSALIRIIRENGDCRLLETVALRLCKYKAMEAPRGGYKPKH